MTATSHLRPLLGVSTNDKTFMQTPAPVIAVGDEYTYPGLSTIVVTGTAGDYVTVMHTGCNTPDQMHKDVFRFLVKA